MSDCTIEQIKVEALLVDKNIVKRDSFRTWRYEYMALNKFESPEPSSFGGGTLGKEKGVYLRFVLPRNLRTKQEEAEDFPFIPNRWLITRIAEELNGKQKTYSWVMESDCPKSEKMKNDPALMSFYNDMSRYLVEEEIIRKWAAEAGDPYRKEPVITKAPKGSGGAYVSLGMLFPAHTWKETAPEILTVRSCAPGNPMFSAYTGHNSGILSFCDKLEGVEAARVSYLVAGWYSKTGINRYYSGAVHDIPWSPAGIVPGKYEDQLADIAEKGHLEVTLAESAQDALRTYARNYYHEKMSSQELDALETHLAAFQQHLTEELHKVGGMRKLSNAAFGERFEARGGGMHYTIESKNKEAIMLTARETQLLSRLNQFEKELEILKDLRQRLMEIWWKRGHLKSMDVKTVPVEWEDFEPALDANNNSSLIRQTINQYETICSLYKDMPKDDACEQYGYVNGVEDNHILRRIPSSRYWQKRNPYLLIKDLAVPVDMEKEEKVAFSLEQLTAERRTISVPSWRAELPEVVTEIYQELFWKYEHEKHLKWIQPWQPMFAEWKITYEADIRKGDFPIQWRFNGVDYTPKFDTASGEKWSFGGISMLDGGSQELIRKTFQEQVSMLSGKDKEFYGKIAEELGQMSFLSQELTGFKNLLAQEDYRTFRRPSNTVIDGCSYLLDEILGFASQDLEFLEKTGGGAEYVPFMRGENVPEFQELQMGIGYFNDLILYDAFGRVLNVISSSPGSGLSLDQNYPLIIPESMKLPDDRRSNRFLIPPTLLQPARLDIRFLSEDGRNPIEGYLMPNSLNGSILVYFPNGNTAGEIAVRIDKEGKRRVCFISFMGGRYKKPEEFPDIYERLRSLIQGIIAFGEDTEGFAEYLNVIDKTFWTMNPMTGTGETVSRLAGRPLACISAQLWVTPLGSFRHDIGWSDTGGERDVPKIFRTEGIPVRLGDAQLRGDGVAGYYVEQDFQTFHSVLKKEDFLEVPFGKKRRVTVTLLMDPDGKLHGYSGMFPVKELDIPSKFSEGAREKMEAVFHTGPFLTNMTEQGIQIPRMLRQHGEWEWMEREHTVWRTHTVCFTDQSVKPTEVAASIREGVLQYRLQAEGEEEKHG